MAFTVIPVSTGYPVGGFSFPNRVSFGVSDDGGGGQVYINGLGVTASSTLPVAGATDLKTLFAAGSVSFQSIPLMRAFRLLTASTNTAAYQQFNTYLEVLINGCNSSGYAGVPAIVPLAGLGGNTSVPFLAIGGPSVAGLWRVDLKLRHSITN